MGVDKKCSITLSGTRLLTSLVVDLHEVIMLLFDIVADLNITYAIYC